MAYYHTNPSNADNSDDNDDNNNMSNPSLRFMYDMDDDILASPTSSLHDSGTTCTTFGVQSPTDDDYDPSPSGNSERRHEKRNSFRQTLSQAFTSPVRAASTKGKLSLISPRKTSSKNSSTATTKGSSGSGGGDKKWRKQLHLPKHVTQDEAIAVLLAKELKMLDF
jgi:hypothetical protein